MSRPISPLKDDRSTKRSKMSPGPAKSIQIPENIAETVADGDAVLVINGLSAMPDTPIGLRVSTHALCLGSAVFKALFATTASQNDQLNGDTSAQNVMPLLDDDGDAMYILCNILHLRNDKLPIRLLPSLLCKVASLAHKYQCVIAAGRSTLQWFDRLYASSTPMSTWEIIEAAYLLDEPMFFARFTSRWVLQQSVYQKYIPAATTSETQKLALVLAERQSQAQTILRNDLDTLADACILAFSKEYKHYIDYAPTMSPEPDETPSGKAPVECRVDPDGAAEYLGALRDAEIWPPTMWDKPKAPDIVGESIGSIVEKLKNFREPEYNDLDKCEFCEDVKIKFTEQLDTVKEEHDKRLWGLCLDCYKAGDISTAECRYEHAKPAAGLGIGGL